MGQIIQLHKDSDNPNGLYTYELPSVPDEKTIWYSDLKKGDQYWKSPANKKFKWLDHRGNLYPVSKMSERDRIEYIDYWRNVWENGLWFMRNGEPTWITGMHVEHLVFNKFKSGNFMYLDSQRERFYFRDLTDKDPLCDGRLWAKGRRVGITAEQVTNAVRVLNSDFSNNVTCQSDTLAKAVSTLLSKIIEVHVKREKWMREVFYSSNGKIPRAALELIQNTVSEEGDYPLGGWARAFPSTVKGVDGEEAMLVILDELSKIEGVSIRELFEVAIKIIVNPGKRGKLDALSTTGDSKEVQKATKEWHQLIADSNPNVRNANGKTNSGLYLWFVSYIHSLELLEKFPAIKDKYGNINKDMAEQYIWNEVNKFAKDTKEYIYALYKMPTVLRHCLLTGGGQGYFPKTRITHRLDELRSLPYDRKPYVVGAFEYDNRGNVYFESNVEREARCKREGIQYTPGYWMVAVQPYYSIDRGVDTRNRYRKTVGGILLPPINPEYGIGYDPIRYKKEDTSSRHLSDAAIIVYKKFDYYNSGICNKYCALYLHRPDDPRDANKEAIKAAKYYGAPLGHERQMESVKEDFTEAGMLQFLVKNPKDDLYGFWVDAQGKLVKNALDWMVTRFSTPRTDDDIDHIAEMPFEPVLVDLDGIDLAETTAFDVFMAMVELEHTLLQIKFTNLTDTSVNNRMATLNEIFPPYQN